MNALLHWRDWPDFLAWVAALATIAAAWFAALTIRQAHKLAERSAEAALIERRLDHELSVLRSLTEAITEKRMAAAAALVNMLGARLPLTRGVLGLDSTPDERQAGNAVVRALLAQQDKDLDRLEEQGLGGVIVLPIRIEQAMQEISAEATRLVQQRPTVSSVSRRPFLHRLASSSRPRPPEIRGNLVP